MGKKIRCAKCKKPTKDGIVMCFGKYKGVELCKECYLQHIKTRTHSMKSILEMLCHELIVVAAMMKVGARKGK